MIFRCKMCGGDLPVNDGLKLVKCEYCGNTNTIPRILDDNTLSVFNRANELRRRCDFDRAEKIYEKIIESDPTEAEAYFGAVLCRFGIEYVDDPKTGKKIPTCHRVQYDAMSADPDYKKALECADVIQRPVYEEAAKEIDAIQKEILALAQKEEPYDVFICYKETDENGNRTADSVIANDIYYHLKQEGYKVFYAAITLEDKLGQDYEPIIFAALNSAKVMLAIGTRPEHFNAVWVKNEWSRFLKIIKKDRTKCLFPCYKDMDAYDLPDDFSHLQALDMGKIGFINDIVRGIRKIIPKSTNTSDKPTPQPQTVSIATSAPQSVAPLLKRAFIFLEDGDFSSGDEYFEKVLDNDPENAAAYLGKLLVDYKLNKREQLANLSESFANNKNFKKAYRYGDDALKAELDGYLDAIKKRISENAYIDACALLRKAKTVSDCLNAKKQFGALADWKDSLAKIKECDDKIAELQAIAEAERKATEEKRIAELKAAEEKRINDIYEKATAYLKSLNFLDQLKAEPLLNQIRDYRDSEKILAYLAQKKNAIYEKALLDSSSEDIDTLYSALRVFQSLSGWRDSDDQSNKCRAKIDAVEARLKQEAAERERLEKEKEIKAKKRKKIMKISIIVGSIATVILVVGLVLGLYVIPNAIAKEAKRQEGTFMYFGSYPQTEVTDTAITSELNALAGTLPTSSDAGKWNSYGYYISGSTSTDYMWYIDLEYSTEKYRGVYFTSYRPYDTTYSSSEDNSKQDDNGYFKSTVYWFKYEPIKWRILSESGGEAFLLSEMIIDSQEYYPSASEESFSHNGGTGYANNYELSNIRKWLNDTFYNTAFSDLEKALILKTTVDNSARSTNTNSNARRWNRGNNNYACSNTEDYIFLLSMQEVTTSAYGFKSGYSSYDTVRQKKNTDYAKSQGCWTITDSDYAENGEWWLRSPIYNFSDYVNSVYIGGNASVHSRVDCTDDGVVPALKIKIS